MVIFHYVQLPEGRTSGTSSWGPPLGWFIPRIVGAPQQVDEAYLSHLEPGIHLIQPT